MSYDPSADPAPPLPEGYDPAVSGPWSDVDERPPDPLGGFLTSDLTDEALDYMIARLGVEETRTLIDRLAARLPA